MTFTLAQWLNIAINAGLPALVALVTARVASPAVKATALLVLSALTGFLVAWGDACSTVCSSFDAATTGSTIFIGLVSAVLSHFGFAKPMGVTGKDGVIQRSVPGGIGSGTA